jgi:hypothetical protein
MAGPVVVGGETVGRSSVRSRTVLGVMRLLRRVGIDPDVVAGEDVELEGQSSLRSAAHSAAKSPCAGRMNHPLVVLVGLQRILCCVVNGYEATQATHYQRPGNALISAGSDPSTASDRGSTRCSGRPFPSPS